MTPNKEPWTPEQIERQIERNRERWANRTPEQIERDRERWANMTPEQRERERERNRECYLRNKAKKKEAQ